MFFSIRQEVVMGDLALRQDVLDELEFQPNVQAAHIGVAVDKAVVTLSGHVGSYPEKLAAVMATKRVKGVRAVADEIDVRYPDDRKSADDEIAQRIVDVLGWDVEIPPGAIQAVVRDGWVTLTGTVEWQFQRKAAESDVHKLSGVRGISNRIEIKPHVQSADVKKKIEEALRRHAEIEAASIRVMVEGDGKVVLEGKVDNWDERFAVENAAWSVPGVRDVVDRLTVS
jgi:osmotically-inducible protein OsmY